MKRKMVSVMGAAIAVLLAGAAYSYAATGDNPSINACVLKVGGTLRIVGSTTQCKSNEAPLTWSKEGLPGPQGLQGAQGLQGPQGIQGEPGTAATVTTSGESVIVVNGGSAEFDLFCPDGTTPIGRNFEGDRELHILSDKSVVLDIKGTTVHAWHMNVSNVQAPNPLTIHASAICLS